MGRAQPRTAHHLASFSAVTDAGCCASGSAGSVPLQFCCESGLLGRGCGQPTGHDMPVRVADPGQVVTPRLSGSRSVAAVMYRAGSGARSWVKTVVQQSVVTHVRPRVQGQGGTSDAGRVTARSGGGGLRPTATAQHRGGGPGQQATADQPRHDIHRPDTTGAGRDRAHEHPGGAGGRAAGGQHAGAGSVGLGRSPRRRRAARRPRRSGCSRSRGRRPARPRGSRCGSPGR